MYHFSVGLLSLTFVLSNSYSLGLLVSTFSLVNCKSPPIALNKFKTLLSEEY